MFSKVIIILRITNLSQVDLQSLQHTPQKNPIMETNERKSKGGISLSRGRGMRYVMCTEQTGLNDTMYTSGTLCDICACEMLCRNVT